MRPLLRASHPEEREQGREGARGCCLMSKIACPSPLPCLLRGERTEPEGTAAVGWLEALQERKEGGGGYGELQADGAGRLPRGRRSRVAATDGSRAARRG